MVVSTSGLCKKGRSSSFPVQTGLANKGQLKGRTDSCISKILWKSPNCERGLNIDVVTPQTLFDKFQKFLWFVYVVYVACLNRAENMVSITIFFRCKNIKLAPNFRHYYLKKIKTLLLTKLYGIALVMTFIPCFTLRQSISRQMQMASC